jgi:hypothetical protein
MESEARNGRIATRPRTARLVADSRLTSMPDSRKPSIQRLSAADRAASVNVVTIRVSLVAIAVQRPLRMSNRLASRGMSL